MRLTHVNHRYAPFVGGSERYVQALSEAFAGWGHAVRVVTTDAFDLEYLWDGARRAVEAPRRERLNGVDVVRTRVSHPPLSSLVFQAGRRALGEASRVVRAPRPYRVVARALPRLPGLEGAIDAGFPHDAILATNVGLESLALSAARVARRHDVPLVFIPFIHLGTNDDPVARQYVAMPHQLELLHGAAVIVAMTMTEADFIAALGVPCRRIVVAGAGVYPHEVTGGDGNALRERLGVRGALVGALGALAPDKGTPDLVRAIGRLRRAGVDVELALAGPALGRFERWFSGLRASERDGVHVLGVIDDATKRDMLSAIDMLALPSRTESFGIVFLEAWANRKPVIGARAGATPEVVRDGDNGLLVPFGDVPAIEHAIRELLTDEAGARELATAGHSLTLGTFTWPRVIERLRGAYNIALGYDVPTGAAWTSELTS